MKITYEITEVQKRFELTIRSIEILNDFDAEIYDAPVGAELYSFNCFRPDYKQSFDTLEGAYAKVSAFASKYHLGDTVVTIQNN